MHQVVDGMVACIAMDGETVLVPAAEVGWRPAAYGVVIDRGRLLMIRLNENGKLFLPGGGSDPHESLHDTARRETEEETGLRVEPGPLLQLSQEFFYLRRDARGVNALMAFFLCNLLDDTDALGAGDPEEGTPEWVPLRSIRPEDLHRPLVEILPAILRDLGH